MASRKSLALAAVGAALLLLFFGCQAGPKSSAGFRLPDGNPERGRQVFLDLRCNNCHRVSGADMPLPAADPPVPVVLGGNVPYAKTDGELVTSIVNPSHQIAPALRVETVKSGELSRMPDYGDLMTVRQMIDLVAFLHSRYTVTRPGGAP